MHMPVIAPLARTRKQMGCVSVASAVQVPVAQGCLAPLNGIEKARIADFVHGTDGFGNTNQLAPKVRTPCWLPGYTPHVRHSTGYGRLRHAHRIQRYFGLETAVCKGHGGYRTVEVRNLQQQGCRSG